MAHHYNNMANPKGHPESIQKYKFKTDRKESCSAHLSLRIPDL